MIVEIERKVLFMTKRNQRFLRRFESWESYKNEYGDLLTHEVSELELLDQINEWAAKNRVFIVNYERIFNSTSGNVAYIIFYEECD